MRYFSGMCLLLNANKVSGFGPIVKYTQRVSFCLAEDSKLPFSRRITRLTDSGVMVWSDAAAGALKACQADQVGEIFALLYE